MFNICVHSYSYLVWVELIFATRLGTFCDAERLSVCKLSLCRLHLSLDWKFCYYFYHASLYLHSFCSINWIKLNFASVLATTKMSVNCLDVCMCCVSHRVTLTIWLALRTVWQLSIELKSLLKVWSLGEWLHRILCSYILHCILPSVLWHCWLSVRKSIRPVKIEWCCFGVVVCFRARYRLFAYGPADATA